MIDRSSDTYRFRLFPIFKALVPLFVVNGLYTSYIFDNSSEFFLVYTNGSNMDIHVGEAFVISSIITAKSVVIFQSFNLSH